MTRWLLLPAAALLIGLYLVAGNPPHANVLLSGAGGGGGNSPVNPGTVTGLAYWFDPSDSTTVFTDAGCTVPATVNTTVLCINDKSGNGCFGVVSANGPTLRNSGAVWWLEFSSNNPLEVNGTGCNSFISNKPFGLMAIGASTSSLSVTQYPFTVFFTTSGATWQSCVNNIDGTTEGWSSRTRTIGTDAAHNLFNATQTTSPVAVRCHIQWTTAAVDLFQNNVSITSCSSCSGMTASNSENVAGTPCIGGFWNAVDCSVNQFTGNIYQIVAVYPSVSDIPLATRTGLDAWNCQKMGTTC